MCKSKRMMALLLGLAMITSLAGCGSSNSLVTDSGSGGQQEIPIEEYLNTDVLGQEAVQADNLYKIHTLEKGDFKEEALRQVLRRSYLNIPTIHLDLDEVQGTFGEYFVEHMQYVEEGDVIATIHTEVDEIALSELEIRLQRLQERYQAAEAQMNEDMEELTKEGNRIADETKREIHLLRMQQRQMDWENEKYNFESRIAETKEDLQKLTQVGEVYEVTAPSEGYVLYNKRYTAGEEIKDGDYVCHIMKSSVIYVSTNSQAADFHYGMDVEFENRTGMTPATVVNGGVWALYGNLDTGDAIFRLDFDMDLKDLNTTALNNLTLTGNLREIKNVILVPKEAVTVDDGEYFVTVLKDDGSLLRTEFIPGGDNTESYWVLEGLTEGMKIVYN